MTSPSPDDGPDTAPIPRLRSGERRRAAVALGVLALGAIVFVAILIAALGLGHGSSGPQAGGGSPSGPAVVYTGGRSPSSGPAGSSGPSSQPSSAPSAVSPDAPPTGGAASCPTSAPCALSTDVGDLVGALNAYRAAHHVAAVSGTITTQATTCAVTSGNQCPAGFYWEPGSRNGAQVLAKMAGRGGGQLLDPTLKAVQVGWAYIPSSHSYECALIVPGG